MLSKTCKFSDPLVTRIATLVAITVSGAVLAFWVMHQIAIQLVILTHR